jgi:pyruvate/2-oxoglutarate dehydrogenase complex dihydrolipoamide acyltransferase (E2) component
MATGPAAAPPATEPGPSAEATTPKPTTPAPRKHHLSADSSDKNLDPPAKRYRPTPSKESIVDLAKKTWVHYRNEIIGVLDSVDSHAKEHPVLWARDFLRTKFETKDTQEHGPVQVWTTVEIRKNVPILCIKTKHHGTTWQAASLVSSSQQLIRDAVVFKAMLMAAKDFESCDFLHYDFFKLLLPWARFRL